MKVPRAINNITTGSLPVEALSFIDHVISEWKIIAFAFGVGAFYYQAKIAIKKIMSALENTSTTHQAQNIILDNINDKIDNLDKRMSKIEGGLEMVNIENHQQSIKLAILETQQGLDDKPIRKRRQSVQ